MRVNTSANVPFVLKTQILTGLGGLCARRAGSRAGLASSSSQAGSGSRRREESGVAHCRLGGGSGAGETVNATGGEHRELLGEYKTEWGLEKEWKKVGDVGDLVVLMRNIYLSNKIDTRIALSYSGIIIRPTNGFIFLISDW